MPVSTGRIVPLPLLPVKDGGDGGRGWVDGGWELSMRTAK
jgi:hypothetical protein